MEYKFDSKKLLKGGALALGIASSLSLCESEEPVPKPLVVDVVPQDIPDEAPAPIEKKHHPQVKAPEPISDAGAGGEGNTPEKDAGIGEGGTDAGTPTFLMQDVPPLGENTPDIEKLSALPPLEPKFGYSVTDVLDHSLHMAFAGHHNLADSGDFSVEWRMRQSTTDHLLHPSLSLVLRQDLPFNGHLTERGTVNLMEQSALSSNTVNMNPHEWQLDVQGVIPLYTPLHLNLVGNAGMNDTFSPAYQSTHPGPIFNVWGGVMVGSPGGLHKDHSK